MPCQDGDTFMLSICYTYNGESDTQIKRCFVDPHQFSVAAFEFAIKMLCSRTSLGDKYRFTGFSPEFCFFKAKLHTGETHPRQ